MKHNEHQVEDFIKMARDHQADKYIIGRTACMSEDNYEQWSPENEQYQRFIKTEEGLVQKYHATDYHCTSIWYVANITCDGQFVVCCNDNRMTVKIGNFQDSDFITVWKSKNFMHFRKAVLTNMQKISFCKVCGANMIQSMSEYTVSYLQPKEFTI
jgi:MoaA/NifB/PqqE/SkfB family radical SAM enzyme